MPAHLRGRASCRLGMRDRSQSEIVGGRHIVARSVGPSASGEKYNRPLRLSRIVVGVSEVQVRGIRTIRQIR